MMNDPKDDNDGSNDLVIRDGFPALLVGTTTNNNNNNSKANKVQQSKWWIDETDDNMQFPRFPFWSHPDAITHKEDALLLEDCQTVFTARTLEDDHAAYSAGVTFFLPAQMKPRCALEALVQSIFQKHVQNLPHSSMYLPEQSGAEWWTLVLSGEEEEQKEDEVNEDGDPKSNPKANNKKEDNDEEEEEEEEDEVGWHFDADYGLEDQAPGLLLHPRLATVTYLTDYGAPTVVLDCKTPKQGNVQNLNGQEINKAWLSYPKVGKHIAFDGRLLHGAPAHVFPSLPVEASSKTETQEKKQQSSSENEQEEGPPPAKRAKTNGITGDNGNNKKQQQQRVTLLVNIWLNHCPLDAELLDDDIVEQLKTPWRRTTTSSNENQDNEKEVTESSFFTWNSSVDTTKQVPELPLLHLQGEASNSSTKDPTMDSLEDEIVLCNHHVKVHYGASREDYHQALTATTCKGSSMVLELGKGRLTLSVGDPVSSDSEEAEEEPEDEDE